MELNATNDLVKDISEAQFEVDVIEASKELPVIVDFWAPWCGPCKSLGPALEAAVQKAGGKVKMVKINVDENQGLAGQLRIQSIPTVYAFKDGKPVDGFQGAQGPAEIDAFIARLTIEGDEGAGMDEALEAAEQMLEAGEAHDAAETFTAIIGEEEGNLKALSGLIRSYLALGEVARAREVLALVPEGSKDDAVIAAVRAQIELAEAAADAGEVGDLRASLQANPDDHQSRLDLALALTAKGETEAAIDELLEAFKRDREWNDGAAKAQLLKLLESLGAQSELAQKGRRKLTSMIFV
ncbi:MAG: thioredoxin [Rhodobacteraceae bacterium]|nr:thioredoxin [Paracoccaceae bacterium]